MNDVGRVDELESAQQLIDEELDVLIRQLLRTANHARKVGLHQLKKEAVAAAVTEQRFSGLLEWRAQ